jgi:hypothetical protein
MDEKLLHQISSLKAGDYIVTRRRSIYPKRVRVDSIDPCEQKAYNLEYRCCRFCPGRIKLEDKTYHCFGTMNESVVFLYIESVEKSFKTKLDEIFEEIDI